MLRLIFFIYTFIMSIAALPIPDPRRDLETRARHDYDSLAKTAPSIAEPPYIVGADAPRPKQKLPARSDLPRSSWKTSLVLPGPKIDLPHPSWRKCNPMEDFWFRPTETADTNLPYGTSHLKRDAPRAGWRTKSTLTGAKGDAHFGFWRKREFSHGDIKTKSTGAVTDGPHGTWLPERDSDGSELKPELASTASPKGNWAAQAKRGLPNGSWKTNSKVSDKPKGSWPTQAKSDLPNGTW